MITELQSFMNESNNNFLFFILKNIFGQENIFYMGNDLYPCMVVNQS